MQLTRAIYGYKKNMSLPDLVKKEIFRFQTDVSYALIQ